MGLRERVESDFGKRGAPSVNAADGRRKILKNGLPTRASTYASTVAKIDLKEDERCALAEAAAIADLFDVSLDTLLGRQAVPGDDLAFALRALRDVASSSMWQIGGIRDALVGRLREAMAFDFDGRDQVGRKPSAHTTGSPRHKTL